MTPVHLCSWLGSNLLRTLPSEIRALTGLKQLWLASNQLTALPEELCDVITLEWL